MPWDNATDCNMEEQDGGEDIDEQPTEPKEEEQELVADQWENSGDMIDWYYDLPDDHVLRKGKYLRVPPYLYPDTEKNELRFFKVERFHTKTSTEVKRSRLGYKIHGDENVQVGQIVFIEDGNNRIRMARITEFITHDEYLQCRSTGDVNICALINNGEK